MNNKSFAEQLGPEWTQERLLCLIEDIKGSDAAEEAYQVYLRRQFLDSLPRVTPDMVDVWKEYKAACAEEARTDTPVNREGFRRELWALFTRLMED